MEGHPGWEDGGRGQESQEGSEGRRGKGEAAFEIN